MGCKVNGQIDEDVLVHHQTSHFQGHEMLEHSELESCIPERTADTNMSGSLNAWIAFCVCRMRVTRTHGTQQATAAMPSHEGLRLFPPGSCSTCR
jgi:hypothetical protein